MVIDPALSYSTYLGGPNGDGGQSVAVDASGNAYVTGYTESSDFPTTAGAFQTVCSSCRSSVPDAFVTKFNVTGSGLVYSTYLGGGGQDVGNGITVDASGDAYVTGTTKSSDFPTTPGAFQTTCSATCSDAFVAKLSPTGSALLYSTYLAGTNGAYGAGISLNASGDAYVTGDTVSTDFLPPQEHFKQPAAVAVGVMATPS